MNSSFRYTPEIDALRAFAIIPVVLYHAGIEPISGGFVGVDIFFVISGYLITGILFKELASNQSISIANFYGRRIRRLLPAIAVVTLATLVLAVFFLSPVVGEVQGAARSLLAALLMVSNIYFATTTGGYFDGPAEEQIVLHTWSLAVEEQFYLVWPLCLIGLGFLSRHFVLDLKRLIVQVLIATVVISLAACIWLTSRSEVWAFYLMPTRAWELAAGALVYFANPRMTKRNSDLLLAVGLTSLLVAIFFIDTSMAFPGYIAILPVLGSVLLILAINGSDHVSPLRSMLRSRLLVGIGLISYPLYLWHWPLLAVYRNYHLGELPVNIAMLLLSVALALSVLTYLYVEQPVRRGSNRATTVGSTLLKGGVTIVLLVASTLLVGLWARFELRSNQDIRSLGHALAKTEFVEEPCEQPRPYEGKLLSRDSCELTEGDDDIPVLLWGDSHAGHLVPAVTESARATGVYSWLRYSPECPPLAGFDPASVGIPRSIGCDQFNEQVLREIEEQKGGQVLVLLSARWQSYLTAGVFEAALVESIRELKRIGAAPIVIGSTPSFAFRAPACLARRSPDFCAVASAMATSVDGTMQAMVEELGVPYVPLTDVLCSDGRCPMYDGDLIWYSDSHHLSRLGSMRLSKLITSLLQAHARPETDLQTRQQ